MKVLFHADLNHGQAAAVWRCRHELEGMGIELIIRSADDPPMHASEFDLALVHSMKEEWPVFLEFIMPLIVLERIDGAQLSAPVRKHIGHPNLRAVIKNTIYASWMKYNEANWRGHELACNIALNGLPADGNAPALLPESKWITPEQYAKLKLGFSFTAYPHYDALRQISPADWPERREYDLHFAGTTDYGPELPWLNWHRHAATEAILNSGLPAVCFSERVYDFREYFKTMRNSRFVVSPWGLGEPCYRDFEAVLCGCMVIKPDTTYIKTVPAEFYRIPLFSRCVCKPDFSDLPDVVAAAQEISTGDRLQWANWLLEQNSTPAIARRLAGIFRGALE